MLTAWEKESIGISMYATRSELLGAVVGAEDNAGSWQWYWCVVYWPQDTSKSVDIANGVTQTEEDAMAAASAYMGIISAAMTLRL